MLYPADAGLEFAYFVIAAAVRAFFAAVAGGACGKEIIVRTVAACADAEVFHGDAVGIVDRHMDLIPVVVDVIRHPYLTLGIILHRSGIHIAVVEVPLVGHGVVVGVVVFPNQRVAQLSKLYAYNGLMLSGGMRVDGIGIDAPHRVIVVDNPEVMEHNVNVITVTDDGLYREGFL